MPLGLVLGALTLASLPPPYVQVEQKNGSTPPVSRTTAGLGFAASPSSGPAAPTQEDETRPANGRVLFRQFCQRCHGADGKGSKRLDGLPDFSLRQWHQGRSDAQLAASILVGKGEFMPSFSDRFNRQQVRDLVSFIRTFAPAAPRKGESSGRSSNQQFDRLQEELKQLQKQFQDLSRNPQKQ
jgi:mono/diheme cytochrome c family protein